MQMFNSDDLEKSDSVRSSTAHREHLEEGVLTCWDIATDEERIEEVCHIFQSITVFH